MHRTKTVVALILILLCSLPTDLLAWGGEGHKIVANVAEARLTPAAKAQIQALLDGAHLADIASWADEVRRDRPGTSSWHYVDIPYEAKGYDAARDCKPTDRGDCVIAEIDRAEGVLRDTSQSKANRAEALKFLVHFVGDLHQPLHAIERSDPVTGKGDRGGNEVHVTFFGTPTNLHAVWDSGIVAHGSVTLDQVQKWLATQDEKALAQGDPIQWAVAAHALAISNSYLVSDDHQLGQDYVDKNVTVVVRQLGSAGLRLASILNSTLSSSPDSH
jgi:hypothetical protein